ncbi:MAG: phosphotransferase [bacterium]|nr:phosphotransferase [bacterium]
MRPTFSDDDVRRVVAEVYGFEPAVRDLPSYGDRNFQVIHPSGRPFVLKIANSDEDWDVLDFQNQALQYLEGHEIGSAVPRLVPTLEGEMMTTATEAGGRPYQVRLLTWLDGTMLVDAEPRPELMRRIGGFLGRLDRALADFSHPAMHQPQQAWDTASLLDVRPLADEITDPERRARIETVLERYAAHVEPIFPDLPASVIHHDGNEFNVLVEDDDVAGLLDFGDLLCTATVAEVAIAMAYGMLRRDEPLAVGTALLAGYHEEHPLSEAELDVVLDLVHARLVMSVCHAAHNRKLEPENTYISASEKPAWRLLAQLEALDPDAVRRSFAEAAPVLRPALYD